MEVQHQEREHHHASSSPNISTTTTCSNNNNNNPPTPKPTITRPDPANPFPTTFIHADTTSFKQVVQMLTGSAETAAKQATPIVQKNNNNNNNNNNNPIPLAARPPGPKKPSFKLYERRGSFRHLKMINPLLPAFLGSHPASPSPRKHTPELLSPSMLDLPSLALSPVTPLIADPFNRCSPSPPSSASSSTMSEEDRAIAEKGFYLHPSPRTAAAAATPTSDPPRLLPLFPVTSPRVQSPDATPYY